MNVESINLVIDNLANKLGVAVDKLLPLLIRQAYISGIVNAMWTIISIIILCISIPKLIKSMRNPETYSYGDWTEWQITKIVLLFVVILFFSITLFFSIDKAIYAFGNPTWYAINDLLQSLKQGVN